MKKYEILISDEITIKYNITAESKEQAEKFAMDNHLEEIKLNIVEETRDRCEIINVEEIKK